MDSSRLRALGWKPSISLREGIRTTYVMPGSVDTEFAHNPTGQSWKVGVEDIAQSVVKELRSAFLGEEADAEANDRAKAEVARAAKGRGADPEAHRLHLLARHLLACQPITVACPITEVIKFAAFAAKGTVAIAWCKDRVPCAFGAGHHEGFAGWVSIRSCRVQS